MGRGPHPRDAELFHPRWHPVLRDAVDELSWLATRGYPTSAALKLVGDRHRLRARQRDAVARCACSDGARAARAARQVRELAGREVAIDGFNCLITCEVALSGGLVLRGRDGAHRDIASIHGSYRRVASTERALELLAGELADAASVTWWLDRPVSNSGRLAGLIRRIAVGAGQPWEVELHNDPDRVLRGSARVVASSDAGVLDETEAWTDLPGRIVAARVDPWVLSLTPVP